MTNYGDTIKARFVPKNLETLRPGMGPLIGRTFTWEMVGTQDEGPYAGQSMWFITREDEKDIPDECKARWVPDEDLQPVPE